MCWNTNMLWLWLLRMDHKSYVGSPCKKQQNSCWLIQLSSIEFIVLVDITCQCDYCTWAYLPDDDAENIDVTASKLSDKPSVR